MKKLVLSAAIAVLGLVGMNAQESSFGAKLGANIATLKGESFKDADARIGLNAGVFYEHFLMDNISIQPELLFSMQGATSKSGFSGLGISSSIETKTKLANINVPVMVKYYPVDKLFLEVGPQFGFNVSSKYKTESSNNVVGGTSNEGKIENLKSFDFGLGFGAGYKIINNLGVNARYVLGLTNIADYDKGDLKNAVIQVGLFYNL